MVWERKREYFKAGSKQSLESNDLAIYNSFEKSESLHIHDS